MWYNAVYMACLLEETLSEYDWNSVGAIPSGFGSQKNFRSCSSESLEKFSNNPEGGMRYKGDNIKNVWMAGFGTITNKEMLMYAKDAFPNRNVYFAYYNE